VYSVSGFFAAEKILSTELTEKYQKEDSSLDIPLQLNLKIIRALSLYFHHYTDLKSQSISTLQSPHLLCTYFEICNGKSKYLFESCISSSISCINTWIFSACQLYFGIFIFVSTLCSNFYSISSSAISHPF